MLSCKIVRILMPGLMPDAHVCSMADTGSEDLPVAMVWENQKRVLERHKTRRNTVITPERYNCEIKLNCKSFERENSFALCSYS